VGHFGSVRVAKVSHCTLVKTLGFVDPEYGVTGKLTEKSDVFSYGMLLLVLISGRRMLESQPSGNPQQINKQISCYKTGMQ
jgi:serine/threonine protein kinase